MNSMEGRDPAQENSALLYPLLTFKRHCIMTDGEGVTTLIAGAGCPLRCCYCLNQKILLGKGALVTPRQLYDRVRIDDLYFCATGGGVTFGGGESLLHAPFIRAFREICGTEWKINAETCLHVPEEHVRIAAECCDFFIVDIKSLDPAVYRAYTGQELPPAFENLLLLKDLVGADRILVRVPLIPGYNSEADQQRDADHLRGLGFTHIDCFSYVIRDN